METEVERWKWMKWTREKNEVKRRSTGMDTEVERSMEVDEVDEGK